MLLLDWIEMIFYHAALNAGRSSLENGFRPSVCLSVKRVDCYKMEEKSVQIFIPYERSFSLVFWEKEWLLEFSQNMALKFYQVVQTHCSSKL